jgi:hypothetical protein
MAYKPEIVRRNYPDCFPHEAKTTEKDESLKIQFSEWREGVRHDVMLTLDYHGVQELCSMIGQHKARMIAWHQKRVEQTQNDFKV